MPRSRKPNLTSSVYRGGDGYWHGRVTVGIREDGTPDRRHVMYKTEARVIQRVRELEREREAGRVRKAGQRWTLTKWLTHWIDNIAAPPNVSENTHSGYRVDVERHLVPSIGAHRLDKLQPEHFEKLYAKLQREGLKPATAHHVHRTVRNALNEAVRRGHLARNPVLVAKAPRVREEEIEPYNIAEVQRLMAFARKRRNGARWVVALALGLRQGEALGLKWNDVDLDQALLRIRRGRLRPKYMHGCGEGHCGRKPGYCPRKRQTRPDTGDTKSRAGNRTIGLPAPLVDLLRIHMAQQEEERNAARQLWHEEGWLFANPDGRPLNPNTDYHE